MENELISENQVKNKVWLKLLITLLVIISIGQISAILLPAMVGQSPKPLSIVGSILWPGLLFMFIWYLRGKKKVKGFIIGGVVGFLLHFSIGVTASYFQAEERAIDKAVAASNKGLPKMIDEETQLDNISIDQNLKSYSLSLSLVNLSLSEIDVAFIDDAFDNSIKPTSCSNENFKIFFNENYRINYVYKDKEGKLVATYTINPTDCP